MDSEESTIVGFQNVEPFATYTHAFDHVGIIGTYVDGRYRRQGIAKKHAKIRGKYVDEVLIEKWL